MARARWFTIAAVLLGPALLAAAQQPAPPGDNILTAPEQLRRVGPPPANLTPQELEKQADALRLQKSFVDAIDYYRAATRQSPSAQMYNKTGIAELQMMRVDDARRDFEKAVKLQRDNPEALNNLGVVHYMKKNYRQAIKKYREAIKISPDSASFHSNLGTAYFARKDFDKATKEYLAALELDPEIFMRQHNGIGVSAHMSSNNDRAHYSYVIAKMYATRGDTERCLLYLRKAIEDGYPVAKEVYKEAEFTVVRKDQRFTELMEAKLVTIPN